MRRGRASTYGNYPGKYRDPGDNNIPALPGASNNNPGIAIYNRRTLGGWYRVTAPNGRTAVIQHTDIGPHPSTGRLVDVNAVAAKDIFGYRYGNAFPTDKGKWSIQYLGKKKPAGTGLETQTGKKTPVSTPSGGFGGGGDRLASVLSTLAKLSESGRAFRPLSFTSPADEEPSVEEDPLLKAAKRRLTFYG